MLLICQSLECKKFLTHSPFYPCQFDVCLCLVCLGLVHILPFMHSHNSPPVKVTDIWSLQICRLCGQSRCWLYVVNLHIKTCDQLLYCVLGWHLDSHTVHYCSRHYTHLCSCSFCGLKVYCMYVHSDRLRVLKGRSSHLPNSYGCLFHVTVFLFHSICRYFSLVLICYVKFLAKTPTSKLCFLCSFLD